jgi:hypothetical protein
MKSLKTLVLAKSISAGALIATGVAAPATSFASPDDGMICRPGYSGQLNGANFKCSKVVAKAVPLDCTNLRFPTKVIRAPGAAGDSSGGKDICVRSGISIGTTDPLTGLVQGQDFVFAEVAASRVAAHREATERAEEANLGLTAADVDSQSSQANVVVNGGFGSNDEARFNVTLFTFPIAAPNFNLAQPILPNLPQPRLP